MTVHLTEQRPQVARPVAEAVIAAFAPMLSRARRVTVGVGGGSGVAVNFLVFNALLHGLAWWPTLATVVHRTWVGQHEAKAGVSKR